MSDLVVRALTDGDWPEFSSVLFEAFLSDASEAERERERAPWEARRAFGIYDGDRMLGGGAILTREITVPGPVSLPAAAVTFVGVRPDARRRGVLGALMRAQLDGLHESGGEAVAVLWSAQAPIYGRFGYGVASHRADARVPAGAEFRPGVEHPGRVELLDAAAAAAPMREVHEAIRAWRVGWLSRPEGSWRYWLADLSELRQGSSAFRYAVHRGPDGPDGYAVFRVRSNPSEHGPANVIDLHELAPASPSASAALWRTMLDLDLVSEVGYRNLALDDPLPLLLLNPRGVVTDVGDQLWLRLVDLGRALAGRRYAAACSVVFEVTDVFCPWNAGRWRLDVAVDGTASVEPSTADPDLRCDVSDLAAAYLGGTRLTALAGAGRVQELRAGALVPASRAFAGDTEPYCVEVF
jgi:predicted acetyltransferase